MRLVPHAAQRPHRCAVIPFLSNHNSRGFFDTGMDLPGWDPHVYVSVEAVEQMATMLGWAPKEANEVALRKVDNLNAQIADRDDQIKVLREQLDAVETLRNAGFKERKARVAA